MTSKYEDAPPNGILSDDQLPVAFAEPNGISTGGGDSLLSFPSLSCFTKQGERGSDHIAVYGLTSPPPMPNWSPTRASASRLNSESICAPDGVRSIISLKACASIIELLSPKAQAACRSTCTKLASAFSVLVEMKRIPAYVTNGSIEEHIEILLPIRTAYGGKEEPIESPETLSLPMVPSTLLSFHRQQGTEIRSRNVLLEDYSKFADGAGKSIANRPSQSRRRVDPLLGVSSPITQGSSQLESFGGSICSSSIVCFRPFTPTRSVAGSSMYGARSTSSAISSLSLLRTAPANLFSSNLSRQAIVINVEAVALRGWSGAQVSTLIRASRNKATPGLRYLYVYIRDNFCANLKAASVEFEGMSKVVSIGDGFLAGAQVESVAFGAAPKLRSIGNDWMFFCSLLREVTFADNAFSDLRQVGSCWLSECQSLTNVDLRAFAALREVGSWWLSRCNSLEAVSFTSMSALRSVGDWWLSSSTALIAANFRDLCRVSAVGSGWLFAAVTLEEVSFSGMVSLTEVGSLWMQHCMTLRAVSLDGLINLHVVGPMWLSHCMVMVSLSLLDVNALSSVGYGWMLGTKRPQLKCGESNGAAIQSLVQQNLLAVTHM